MASQGKMQLVVPDCAGSEWLAKEITDYCTKNLHVLCQAPTVYVSSPADRTAYLERLQGAAIIMPFFKGAPLDREILNSIKSHARLVSIIGPGGQNIDMDAAEEYAIPVVFTNHAATGPVAEMTIGLMLQLARDLPYLSYTGGQTGCPGSKGVLPEHFWRTSYSSGLYGRSLGLVGLGETGQNVAQIAKAMGMDVFAWSPNLTQEKAEQCGCRYLALPELMKTSDVVSLHLRLGETTEGLINRQLLETMKEGACLINTSRGRLVDEAALQDLLRQNRIRAGLDVFSEEPLGPRSPWFSVPNTVLTPHAAWQSQATIHSFLENAKKNTLSFFQTRARRPRNEKFRRY